MRLVGYADALTVEPGSSIAFMVSSQAPRYDARIVRLIHGTKRAGGPGHRSEHLPSTVDGSYEGAAKRLLPGSYVRVPGAGGLELGASFTLTMWIWATTPDKAEQTLLDQGGRVVTRLDAGSVVLVLDDAPPLSAAPIAPRTWYFVAAVVDAQAGEVRLSATPLRAVDERLAVRACGALPASRGHAATHGGDLLLAAESTQGADGPQVGRFYNGKIAAPSLFARALDDGHLTALRSGAPAISIDGLACGWDFSVGIPTREVAPVGARRFDGHTLQMPMRGATGPHWSGHETAWPHAHAQYDAIHFHDDDLDDAGWEVDLRWEIPESAHSGVYALHVSDGDAEDHIPFVIRPRRGRPTARIALLLPTYSYLAYANEHMLTLQGMSEQTGVSATTAEYPSSPEDRFIIENRLLSLYDEHDDGSGVCYASRLRPLVNLRPGYEMAVLETPHQLGADLQLVDWLYEHGYRVDVITDEDLDEEGARLLEPYKVVLSGTHCEYWSLRMIDETERYLEGGGRFMYLGGNGMYWVTARDQTRRHTVEVRRRGPGTRTWEPEAGEAHLSSTGELGGLWRYRGRAPQRWLGVGFSAAGGRSTGRPFTRTPASRDPRVAWIFDGVVGDAIGDLPSLIIEHGAAAQEIDRADRALGTPAGAIVLASATGFSDLFQRAVEEVFQTNPNEGGTQSPAVRADMVLVPYPGGGAVFATSSIAWCGCLSVHGYRNDVSRVTANVLDRFAADGDWDPTA